MLSKFIVNLQCLVTPPPLPPPKKKEEKKGIEIHIHMKKSYILYINFSVNV